MKLRLSFFSVCAMLLMAGALFTSCTQTSTPTTTTTAYTDTYADVTGLADGTQYQFSVTSSNSGTVISGVSSYANGTVRVFWTRATHDSSQVTVNHPVGSTSTANNIVWAPADKSGSFRIFETSAPASVGPSGLILGAPATTALVSGSQASLIDLVLATDNSLNPPFLSLQAADQGSVTNGRGTELSAVAYQVKGGLAMNYFSSDLTYVIPTGSGSVGSYDFSTWANITDSSSIVIPVRTADGTPHYARVEIIPQTASSNHLWGDDAASGKRFIDVNVTNQTQPGWAYAGRPGEVRRGTNTHRLRGGAPVRQ